MKLILVILLFVAPLTFVHASESGAFSFEIKKARKLLNSDNEKCLKLLEALDKKSEQLSTRELFDLEVLFHEYYKTQFDFEASIKHLNKAIENTSKDAEKAPLFYELGLAYYQLNNYHKAIYFFTEVLRLFDVASEKLKAKTESMLGGSYAEIRNERLAKKYMKSSVNRYRKLGEMDSYGVALVSLGSVYSKFQQYKEAIHACLEGVKYFKQKNDVRYETTLYNMGGIYRDLKQYDSALIYLNNALKLAKELGDVAGELSVINNLATIYQDQNQTQKALEFYLRADKLADEIGDRASKKQTLFNLSTVYNELGQTQKSYDYYRAFIKLKEELFSEDNARFVVETQEKYEATRREAQIAELKVKKQQIETEKLAMKYMIIIVSILGLFVLVLVGWFYRAKLFRLRAEQEKAINEAALESEEKERLRISQEIHDDLGGVLGMSRMLFSRTKRYLLEQDQELYQRIDTLLLEANNRSRAISHELFSPTLKEFGLYKALDELFHHVQVAKPNISVEFEKKGDDQVLDEAVSLNMYRIVQELVNNTFKYAEASLIRIRVNTGEQNFSMHYQDNGLGVDLSLGKHGVGLKSIQSRVNRVNGKVQFDSAPGKGFQTTIQIDRLAS